MPQVFAVERKAGLSAFGVVVQPHEASDGSHHLELPLRRPTKAVYKVIHRSLLCQFSEVAVLSSGALRPTTMRSRRLGGRRPLVKT